MGDFIKTLTSLIGSIKAKVDGKIGILQKRIDDIPTETVLYTPQTLTEGQQKQARDNIGAIDAGSMFVVITKSTQNGETIYSADKTYDEIMEAVANKIVPVCNNPVVESAYGPQNIRCIFRNSFYVTGVEYASFQSDGDEYFYEVLIFRSGKVTATSKPKIMTGATTDNSGTSGMVPLPSHGDNTKFLRGDATWSDVPQYELPVASNEKLGGVKPVAKTDAMTQDVGVDKNGKLYTKPAEGGGETWEKLVDTSLAEAVESVTYTFDNCKRVKALIAPVIASGEPFSGWTRITINNVSYPVFNSRIDTMKGIYIEIDSVYPPYVQASIGTNSNTTTYGFIGGIQTTALENIAPKGITELGCQTAGLLKAGTRIEIWGVKS